ncbi:toxin-antitoxin system YwqK family antitoxin [Pontibacter sp. MBLB2868]|uniref:toxin-antitoxin system YwqK family antitoxin n=1 Tax=Pontibacter sp. MBLB2868 TaxID=3451555 RepID=UPI003F756869
MPAKPVFTLADYLLTSPSCASFFREATYDSTIMAFDGPFKDFRYDSLELVEGTYKNGLLNGPLVIRYMNGHVWQKGLFNEGLMTGTWEYFFPNGKPMYSFTVKGNKLVVQNVWSIDGRQLVQNGNGEAIIYHYNSKSTNDLVETSWRGKFKNGLLSGRWKLYYFDSPTKLSQEYVKGRFVKGYEGRKFFNAVNYFGLGQEIALLNAEKLRVGSCDANPTNAIPPTYNNGWIGLKYDLYQIFDSLTNVKFKSVDIVVSFNVDDKGNLGEFKELSETGYEAYLIKALQELGVWSPAVNDAQAIAMKVVLTFPYRTKIWRDALELQNSKGKSLSNGNDIRWDHSKTTTSPVEIDPWQKGYKL